MRTDERTRLIPVVVLTSSKLDEDILDSYRSAPCVCAQAREILRLR